MIIEAMLHVGKYLLSATLGAFIIYWFFWPEFTEKTEIVEVRTTDTVYVTIRDTVRIREVRHEYLRDTILSEPMQPQIKAFTASTTSLYGNTYVSGEVLGEVLKMNVVSDIKSPLVTNTIKETVTITKKPAGFYLTAGIAKDDSQLSPYVGAIFIKDRYLIGLNTQSIQFGYRIR